MIFKKFYRLVSDKLTYAEYLSCLNMLLISLLAISQMVDNLEMYFLQAKQVDFRPLILTQKKLFFGTFWACLVKARSDLLTNPNL